MKFLFTLSIFLITPFVFCLFLVYAFVPLLIQQFLPEEKAVHYPEYPYLTSWEEAA